MNNILNDKKTILIVEDEMINRLLLRKIFEKEYMILEASNGQEALDILQSDDRVSIIILDIYMPLKNGFEVLEAIKNNPQLSSIPTIIVSASNDEETQLKALSAGAMDVITKPFNQRLVLHRINNLVNQIEATKHKERAERYEQYLKYADTDELTGLYNKNAFIRIATKELADNPDKDYILVRWDIDNFKVFNDAFGSEAGNEFLLSIGKYYLENENSIKGLVLVARYQADHFILLYDAKDFNEHDFVNTLELILFKANHYPYECVPRVGVYKVTDRSLDVSLMCDRVFLALKNIKNKFNKNIEWYTDSLHDDLINERNIINSISNGLKNKEFKIFLQGQFNLNDNSIIGAEALVRWERPGYGLVSPASFIPIFEKNGYIFELDKYVWEETCILLRKWLDNGIKVVPISVNISRYDFSYENLYETICELLEKYNIPVELLRLEITESAFSNNTSIVLEKTQKFQENGFHIEIDDFGSEYSSLNTLKNIPADTLKLDMKFFGGDGITAQRGGNIIESVVRMAKLLNTPIIAEGVETSQQALFLKSIGCQYAQGYLYSRPISIAEFESTILNNHGVSEIDTIKLIEGMNQDKFWNPDSIDSLIFSSYVGAACVIEYSKEKCEMIRINSQFVEALRTKQSTNQLTRYNIFEVLPEEDMQSFKDNVEKHCSDVGDSISGNCTIVLHSDEPAHTEYLHYRAKVIAKLSNHYIMYVIVENITEQKIIEEKERSKREQLDSISEITKILLTDLDHVKNVNITLEKVLSYFGGDRSYVLELNWKDRVLNNTYEYCAPGIKPARELLTNVSFSEIPGWIEEFKDGECVILDPDSPTLNKQVAELLKFQNIKKLVAIDLRWQGKLIGMLGVDNPVKKLDELEYLKSLSHYVALPIVRRDLYNKYQIENKMLYQMMEDMPGGFVRMRIEENGKITPIYINSSFRKLFNMTEEEIWAQYKTNAYNGVHPDDLASVENIINETIQNRGTTSIIIRFINKDNEYVPIQTFYRITIDENNLVYLNGYYGDLTHQSELDNNRRKLLDNLPCGAAIFELVDGRLKCIHINKNYCNLIAEIVEDDYSWAFYDLVHPKDIDKLHVDIQHAIAKGVDIVDNIRLLGINNEYVSFDITGRVIIEPDGRTFIYVNYYQSESKETETNYSSQLDLMLSSSTVAFWILDLKAWMCSPLNAYANKLGKLLNMNKEMFSLSDNSDILAICEALLNGEQSVNTVLQVNNPDSEIELVHIGWYAILSQDGTPTCALGIGVDGSDIYIQNNVQQRVIEEALEEAKRAKLDGTTGIYSRNAAETEIVNQLKALGRTRCAYIFLDVDNLKHINDEYGHPEGDMALRKIANLLKKHFSDNQIIGRIGGDEFAIFIPNVSEETNLDEVISNFVNELPEIRIYPNNNYTVSCSIGYSVGYVDAEDWTKLYREADVALYTVKRHGKNNFAFYSAEMEE